MEATPHYATREDLSSLETHLVKEMADFKAQIFDRMDRLTWRLLWLMLTTAGVVVAASGVILGILNYFRP